MAMLNISQSYVSRLISKTTRLIKKILQNPPNNKKQQGRKPKSIFKLLPNYSRSEIIKVILSLDEEETILLKLRYGENLDNPNTSPLWNKDTVKDFILNCFPK